MKAVMYGAGNIGRGFVGALMSQAGYEVCFIDVDANLVAQLNARGGYTQRIISDSGQEDRLIRGIRAVSARDEEAVFEAIAGCDLMATAVGVRVLPLVAPLIARGLALRFERGVTPLDIILCENLMGVGQIFKGQLQAALSVKHAQQLERQIGLVEASIGRMVPIQTDEMRGGDPLCVCVEPYELLPVDVAAFRGALPDIPQLVPFAPFDFYFKRKLYLHNMAHAVCAYLGDYMGLAYIYEAIQHPYIELITRAAMQESLLALSQAYHQPASDLAAHVDDLLHRFSNRALGDSTARVGADIPRKLAAQDRLIGAAQLCLAQGIQPVFIALGAAAALHQFLVEQGQPQTNEQAEAALSTLSGLPPAHELHQLMMQQYTCLQSKSSLAQLYEHARLLQAQLRGPIV